MSVASGPTKQHSRYIRIILQSQRCVQNKSLLRQTLEILALFVRSRLGPGYYIQGRMFQKSFSTADVLGFLSYRGYKSRLQKLNRPLYKRSSQNKAIEKALLTTYAIPTPALLGCFRLNYGIATDGQPLASAEDLMRVLSEQPAGSKVCLKPVEGSGGRGFIAIEIIDAERVKDLKSGKVISSEDFAEKIQTIVGDGMVVEQYIEQATDYAAFNISSVNTVRVLARQMADGETLIIGAFLRIGRKGALVDNGEAGGIIVPIDLVTGRLERGMSTQDYGVYYDKHPDSGAVLSGFQLPRLQEAIACTRKALSVFPRISFAGSDIAFTEKGPVVLEMNVEPSYIDFALVRAPSRRMLE